MYIDVLFRIEDIIIESLNGITAVVFDVLRASSTMISALAAGCTGVMPVGGVKAAQQCAYRLRQTGSPVLLGGERNGQRLSCFDCGNSPLEYTKERVSRRRVVLTTSNGTRAVDACVMASKIYFGGILNARAVARRLWSEKEKAVLVCAGTGGKFSLEDTFGAGLVILYLQDMAMEIGAVESLELSDTARAAACIAVAYCGDPVGCLYHSRHGKKLLSQGFGADLKWCASLDKFNFVPVRCRESGLVTK